jgi:hypothetical protein
MYPGGKAREAMIYKPTACRNVGCPRWLEGNYEASIPMSTWILKKSNIRVGKDKLLLQTVKGKAIPLQAWPGPEGFRRLRLPDTKTIST